MATKEKTDAPQLDQQQQTAVTVQEPKKRSSLPAKLVQAGITQWLSAPKTAFLAAGGTEQQFNREINFAVDLLNEKDYLLQCASANPESLVTAIKNVGLTGLTLNPILKLGYLVSRKGKIVFQSSYMGKREILMRSGIVRSIEAQLVYEGDEFEFVKGNDSHIHHKPDIFGARDRNKIKGGYWIAKLSNGEVMFDAVPMTRILEIMNRSEGVKAGKTTPWETDFEQMARKTIINAAFSQLPKSGISDDMLKVLSVEAENDEEDLKDYIKEQEQNKKDAFAEDANYEEVN